MYRGFFRIEKDPDSLPCLLLLLFLLLFLVLFLLFLFLLLLLLLLLYLTTVNTRRGFTVHAEKAGFYDDDAAYEMRKRLT